MSRPKIIDLFSGVGGMSLGFENAGFQSVVANEIDTEIAQSFRKNHPGTLMLDNDITKLDLYQIFSPYRGIIDGIVGGPPCQGFSQKGHRKSIKDDRNFLFKSFHKVVEIVKPKFFVMENVPNLLTTEGGYFALEIQELFRNIGYTLTEQILSADEFGVPQRRRRAIITGILDHAAPRTKVRPKAETNIPTVWDAIGDLEFLNSGEGVFKQEYRIKPRSQYQVSMSKDSPLLYNHMATNHTALALERMRLVPAGGGRESLPAHHLTKSIYSGTWGRMHKDETSVTITTRFDTPSSGKFTHPTLDRAITVREAARIQSFPDSFIFHGTKSSQMKQVGNAVPPLLARAVADSIFQEVGF